MPARDSPRTRSVIILYAECESSSEASFICEAVNLSRITRSMTGGGNQRDLERRKVSSVLDGIRMPQIYAGAYWRNRLVHRISIDHRAARKSNFPIHLVTSYPHPDTFEQSETRVKRISWIARGGRRFFEVDGWQSVE